MQAGLKTISRMLERRERALKQPRACANDATATFFVALAEAVRRRRAIIHDGTAIDLLTVAPKTAVAWWIGQLSVLQTISSVKPRSEVPPISWKGPSLLLRARTLESRSFWQKHKVKLASEATWARQELRNRLRRNKEKCLALFGANRHTVPPLFCVPTSRSSVPCRFGLSTETRCRQS